MFDLIQFYRFFSPIASIAFSILFLPNLGNPKFEVLIVVMILPPCFVIALEYAGEFPMNNQYVGKV